MVVAAILNRPIRHTVTHSERFKKSTFGMQIRIAILGFRNIEQVIFFKSKTITSGERLLTRGRIAGRAFSLGKFKVTLDYFCGGPIIGMLVDSMRGNPDVITSKLTLASGISTYLMRGSLGPYELTSRTASRSVQTHLLGSLS